MRILFFTRSFYPHIGGVEKHLLEVAKRLSNLGNEVIIITEQIKNDTSKSEEISDKDTLSGITLYRIPITTNEKRKKYQIWKWLWRHRHLIEKAAIVHAHDVFYWYLPFRLLYPRKKIFTTFHGYEGNAIPQKKAIVSHKIAEVLSFGNICVGRVLEKWYGTKATFITYGAATPPQTKPLVSTHHTPLRTLFIGRLEEETGIMVYLYSLRLLKQQGVKISLLVLGDGKQREEAESYVKQHQLDVEFRGFVLSPEDYISKADIVFASRYLAILEAFTRVKYVISVYNNAIKKDYLEMTPFCNWIAVCKDENEVVKSITMWRDEPKTIDKRTEDAYSWVIKQTWDGLCTLYLKLWQQ